MNHITYTAWDLTTPFLVLNAVASIVIIYIVASSQKTCQQEHTAQMLYAILGALLCIDLMYFTYQDLYLGHILVELAVIKVGIMKWWSQRGLQSDD